MEIPRMPKVVLREKLEDPAVILIDVRRDESISAKIPGAVREDPEKVDQWEEKYPKDRQIVLYCS
jgi:rhodanese-related sulfurtransferase